MHGDVDSSAIVRGYEYGPGQHVVVEPDELDKLLPAQDKALRLERFLAPAQLDPLLFVPGALWPDRRAGLLRRPHCTGAAPALGVGTYGAKPPSSGGTGSAGQH